MERGRCYRQIKKYAESISDLKIAVEKFSKKPELDQSSLSQNDLGLSYYEDGKFELALEMFNKAVDERPENPVFYNNRGLAFTNLDEYS